VRAQNQLETMNKGISHLDSVLQDIETDPRFIRVHKATLARLAEAQPKLTNIQDTYILVFEIQYPTPTILSHFY